MLHRTLLGLLAIAAAVGFGGCGDLNGNPAESSGGTATVSLDALQSQMGYSTSGGIVAPAGNDWTTVVDGLVVGAIIVSQSTPYTADTIDDDTSSNIEDDAVNSINYFSIIDLPTSASTVQFFIPPPSAGNWQIAAIGLTSTPNLLGDLDGGDAAYYAFSDTFLNTDDVEGTTVSLTLKRACLSDEPPKGCAQYDSDGTGVVTSRVTIRAIFHIVNGSPFGGDANDLWGASQDIQTGGEITAENAMDAITGSGAALSPGNDMVVITSHENFPGDCNAEPYYSERNATSPSTGKRCYQVYTTPF